MKVFIRLVSIGGDVDSSPVERDVDAGTDVEALIRSLGLDPTETFAVLIDDMPVAPADRAKRLLADGDRVTVFPPIKGG